MKSLTAVCLTLLCVGVTSSLYAQTTTESTSTQQSRVETTQGTSTIPVESTSSSSLTEKPTNAPVEAYIKEFFKDTPIMISIAECESHFRQYTDNGNVLGSSTSGMIGVFQIYGDVHKSYALQKGYNIYSLEGNAGYAQYLYKKEGTNPWMDSFSCWKAMTSNPESTKITIIAATTTTEPLQQQTKATTLTIPLGTFSTNMSFGITHPNVLILQRILNNLGYTITINGPGSPGNETAKFGSLTRDAVRRFQCAKQIVCSGDEGTTGYGYVGNRTRLALINMYNQTTPKEVNKQTQKTTSNEDQIATLESQIQTLQNNIMELRAKVEILKSGH